MRVPLYLGSACTIVSFVFRCSFGPACRKRQLIVRLLTIIALPFKYFFKNNVHHFHTDRMWWSENLAVVLVLNENEEIGLNGQKENDIYASPFFKSAVVTVKFVPTEDPNNFHLGHGELLYIWRDRQLAQHSTRKSFVRKRRSIQGRRSFTDQTVVTPRTRAASGAFHVAAFVRLVPIATPVALLRTIDPVHWRQPPNNRIRLALIRIIDHDYYIGYAT